LEGGVRLDCFRVRRPRGAAQARPGIWPTRLHGPPDLHTKVGSPNELGPRGIRVNGSHPGWVDTDMERRDARRSAARRVRSGPAHPSPTRRQRGRPGRPILFLVSYLARHVRA
jgi:hypothetical protein